MDPVIPSLVALRAKVEKASGALQQAALAAHLNDDPLKEQLQAMALTLPVIMEVSELGASIQADIAASLDSKAEAVAEEAIARVQTAGMGILDQLTPRLVALVERSSHRRLKVWRLRSILGLAALALLALSVSGGYVYAIGYTAGRTNGELVGHTIAAAMTAGPEAAADWAELIVANDPREALVSCKKSVETDEHGRRYCQMPVWLEPPQPPTRSLEGRGS
jgi:hypothetical protein